MIIQFTPLKISVPSQDKFRLHHRDFFICEKEGGLNPFKLPIDEAVFLPRKQVIDNIMQFSKNFMK